MIAVVKVGTSSITDDDGRIDGLAIAKVCAEIVAARGAGHDVVLVSSGAIAAGLFAWTFVIIIVSAVFERIFLYFLFSDVYS